MPILGTPENIPNPSQSDRCTPQSEAKSVDIVRTSFLPPRSTSDLQANAGLPSDEVGRNRPRAVLQSDAAGCHADDEIERLVSAEVMPVAVDPEHQNHQRPTSDGKVHGGAGAAVHVLVIPLAGPQPTGAPATESRRRETAVRFVVQFVRIHSEPPVTVQNRGLP